MNASQARPNKLLIQSLAFRFIPRTLVICSLLAVFWGEAQGNGQKKSRGKTGGPVSTSSTSSRGKGKTGGPVTANPSPEEIKPIQGRTTYVPVIRKVLVPPTEGYLALFTVPTSEAVLRPVLGANEFGKPLKPKQADKEGWITFPSLPPGNYRIDITCEDYDPFDDIISIQKGRQTVRQAALAAKFATLRLGLGNQAGEDITIRLDGKPFPKPKVEPGQLILDRVPVGKHTFNFLKSGFSEWALTIEIRPGNNFVSATMEAETIAVTVKTQPRAEVYVDGEQKREASAAGELKLNLPLGEHIVRVRLTGFEPADKPLSLAKEPRALTMPIPLMPIAEDAAFEELFEPGVNNWAPFPLPAGWQMRTERPKGLNLVEGLPAFVFKTTIPNRQFNIYRDFDLMINLRLSRGKGLAWIVRALDEKNYYQFELDADQKKLAFCIYQNGVRRQIDVANTVVGFEDRERSYRIRLRAEGGKFFHTIETLDGEKPLGIVFEDSTFGYGGIGLRGLTGAEVFINRVSILKTQPGVSSVVR
jgi:hypothetical protein